MGLRGLCLLAVVLVACCGAPSSHAQTRGLPCLIGRDAVAQTAPPQPLRIGITPQAAGSAGGGQGDVAPEDETKALAALRALQPPGRRLVIRLNRLFMADGDAGIARFSTLARTYARAGFDVESQVRYHPSAAQEGDMAAWESFVRRAATVLGRNRRLVALSITNEVNLPISSNTSDGAYRGAVEAIRRGVPAARAALNAIRRRDVRVGFTYAWRWLPGSDDRLFARLDDPAFRRAVDHVGLQLYPGLFWPPVFLPGDTAGKATVEAADVLRSCFMPKARLGPGVAIWITENGYATNLNRRPERQDAELRDTLASLHAVSGTLGVSDYRWFNLRDNRSNGGDLFSAVGLLFDDYRPKPAFATMRALITRYGPAPPRPGAARCGGSCR